MKATGDFNMSDKKTLTPLIYAVNSPQTQSGHSKSPDRENRKRSRKRWLSVTDKCNNPPKRARIDVNVTSNENSEFSNAECSQDELHNASHTKRYIPHRLLELMYQLDLSVLCSLRKSTYQHKYPVLSLAFEDSETDKFNDIVLRYEEKSIHVQIEYVDKYNTYNNINYAKLFTKGKRSFFINKYFDSFVKHITSKLGSSFNNIDYFIIYTNSGLDLTEESRFKKERSRNFYPFKFDRVNVDILKDFLLKNDDIKRGCSYQFSQDETTREELSKRLTFSPAMKKAVKERKLYQEEIKDVFLDKLVFTVNQPNRETLNSIIKNKIETNSTVEDDYIALQEKILRDFTAPGKHQQLGPGIIYKFNLLLFFLHDMFLRTDISFIKTHGTSDITVRFKDKITYVKVHTADRSVDYSQLFFSRQHTLSINKLFTLFVEESKEDMKYFVIYTNAKDFYPLEFDSIDIRKKKYKILRDCSCLNQKGLYRFAQGKTREKLLSLLKPSLQKEKGILSNDAVTEAKEKFLNKLIFALNQHNREELSDAVRNDINKSNVPYNYEELHEIALRWSESPEFGPITKGIMEKLLEDIKNNRSSYHETQNKGIGEEIKFAKNVVGQKGTSAFTKFLDFLVNGEGKKHLQVLKRNKIKLTSMSSILDRARTSATKAFKDLYNLWFDEKGNKTRYLKALEKEEVHLSSVSSILSGAGANAAKAYEDLYDLWFDAEGNKTYYLKTLEEEGINLYNVSSILSRAGANAAKVFKDLYVLWFDKKRNKTQYLRTLEKEGINLTNISSILNGARTNAAKAFKGLYNVWFDAEGNKTQYLKTLEGAGINLANISGILSNAGAYATKAFTDLYALWFDEEGNKTEYLKTLEEEGVNLTNTSSILNGAGASAAKAFKDLYDLWFDSKGNKTQYLKALEKEGIHLANVSSILNGAGANAAKAFKDLYDLWFDEKGNKTQYLRTLEGNGIHLTNISSILLGVGANAAKAFKDLYVLWFDEEGNKTQYLKTLEEEGINLANTSGILNGVGTNAAKAFKDLYDLWFDEKGNKTQYLRTLEGNGIHLTNISSILHGVGANAAKAFKDLYVLWFDEEGNKTQYLKTLEEEGINLSTVSSILNGAGSSAAKAFKNLYRLWFDEDRGRTQYLKTLEEEEIHLTNTSSILDGAGANATKAFKELYNALLDEKGRKTRHLKDFIKKNGFTIHNVSGILSGSGASAKDAFEKLHSLFINGEGKRTKLLDDFYNADFEPGNLSCMLYGAGARASSILRRFHSVCFDDEGKRTELLDSFYNAGFRPGDLCNILSGTADSLEEFYYFCFIGETRKYLNYFLNERDTFTLSNLCDILHGSRGNVCSALKDFCGVCFDEAGNKTQLINDFSKAGFKPLDLSNILSMAGNNASSMLRNFHKSCFNKEDYLNHFLTEKNLFTQKNLSKILRGVGINVCTIFEKLHHLCFDKTGNKTDYLNSLINNNPPNQIYRILYKKVRKGSSTFLDKQNISEGTETINARLGSSDLSKPEQNLNSLQGGSKVKRKKNRQETTDGMHGNPLTLI